MSEAQTFTCPNPPSVNNLYFTAGKRRVTSKRYAIWKTAAGHDLLQAKLKPIDGPYELAITIGRPDKRRRDLANLEKPVSDLLVSHGIVRDDSDLHRLFMSWGGKPGTTTVRLYPFRVAE